ncbi:MAG: hypothetical protein AAGA75_00605 [Cyanobacteria bacterium P01_E01_bin.6]
MTTNPVNLKVLVRPCNSGMCPTLYQDDQGRVFVQGNRLSDGDRSNLSVANHEEVVEISPDLLSFLRSQA